MADSVIDGKFSFLRNEDGSCDKRTDHVIKLKSHVVIVIKYLSITLSTEPRLAHCLALQRTRYGRPGSDGLGMYNAEKRRTVSGESWRQTYVDNEVGEDREKGGSTS